MSRRMISDEADAKVPRRIMIINKTPLTEELYTNYIIHEYSKTYSVNIKNRFKSQSKHILISNY